MFELDFDVKFPLLRLLLEPSFKIQKLILKRDLLKNGKNKNVLEIDVEKDGGIILKKKKKKSYNKHNPFKDPEGHIVLKFFLYIFFF